MNQEATETQARDALAACNQTGYQFAGTPGFILPEGYAFKDLSHLMPAPTRKKGTTTLNDAESFIAVVNDQKAEGGTRLFSTINPPTFTAVFNHIGDEPGWGDHKAKYNAPISIEWGAWVQIDKKKLDQVEMAQFLESNLVDIVHIPKADATPEKPAEVGSPDGATMLEICRTLQAKKDVEFKSAVRLGDGSTQFTYNEEVRGSAANGNLSIPEQFSIGVPVFENGQKYRVDVRFRYRIGQGGDLTMWLELVRPHKVIEDAVKQLREHIAEKTSLPILNGTPNA
ncbi:DUF2303 family protein [Acidovorax sp. NB1]|uniref:DUF2303 family protein n=1 Tax=Acidovorax sp. NB1 TaxID=1943571 RepID=UPI0010D0A9D7|nr:DUF2303 family protein [Acidovorax sp. NB1]GDY37272.1 hypothetical protein ACINB_31640 [Acidovorax sp. NB1]